MTDTQTDGHTVDQANREAERVRQASGPRLLAGNAFNAPPENGVLRRGADDAIVELDCSRVGDARVKGAALVQTSKATEGTVCF